MADAEDGGERWFLAKDLFRRKNINSAQSSSELHGSYSLIDLTIFGKRIIIVFFSLLNRIVIFLRLSFRVFS